MTRHQRFCSKRQLLALTQACSISLILAACQSQPTVPNTVSIRPSALSEPSFSSKQATVHLTAPPAGLISAQPLTAPPLGIKPRLTAPPLGLQPELEASTFEAFDLDQDQNWNLAELNSYLDYFAARQAGDFSTKSGSHSPYSAVSLMQRFDNDANQLLDPSEARRLHQFLMSQTQQDNSPIGSVIGDVLGNNTVKTTVNEVVSPLVETGSRLLNETTAPVAELTTNQLPESVSKTIEQTSETALATTQGLLETTTSLSGQQPQSEPPAEPDNERKKILGLL